MGNKLCQNGIFESEHHHTHVILQHQFQQNKNILNQPLGERGMNYITKNSLPLYKMNGEDKYYCGHFHNGKAQGLGIIFIPNRSYYEGQLKEGLPDGGGYFKVFFKDDVYQIYDGEFREGMAHGKGNLVCRHNKIYFEFSGRWEDSCAKQGIIIPKFESEVQQIEIRPDIKVIKFKNGDIYQGSLNSYFQPNGFGVLVYNKASPTQSYNGGWFRGKFSGEGTCKWKDGSLYVGHYIDGEKQGEGKFVFPSGKYYNGHWLDGMQHGKGELFNKDGKILEKGIWIKGKVSLALESTEQQLLRYEKLPQILESQKKILNKHH